MLDELLRRLDSWAYLSIERRPGCVILRVRDVVVGDLQLASRVLSVDVPGEMLGPLLRVHPHLRETKDGVSVQVTDLDSRAAAEALLRWRIELERFGWQLLAASP
jgi:hypothetical protein